MGIIILIIAIVMEIGFAVYCMVTKSNQRRFRSLIRIGTFTALISSSINKCGKDQQADKYYVIEKMNSLVLDFFNYYLKDKGSFLPVKFY